MDLSSLTLLLRERIGLDPESLGANALFRVVSARMMALRLSDPAEYALWVLSDPTEYQTLINELAVPETWFFRGGDLFTYLASEIREAVLASASSRRFQVLSIPCSTGEEPYSLAMSLQEIGVSESAWTIDGVDISSRHIAQAREGQFREFSFRQTSPMLRGRYFREVSGAWELLPSVRSLVQFHQGNLFDQSFVLGEKTFDLIFCRNLLIYLHSDARRRALDILHRMMRPGGYLCVGHAEPLDSSDRRFVKRGPAEYFVYGRADAPQATSEVIISRRMHLLSKPAATPLPLQTMTSGPALAPKESSKVVGASSDSHKASGVTSQGDLPPSENTTSNEAVLLDLARQRANEGQLTKRSRYARGNWRKDCQRPIFIHWLGLFCKPSKKPTRQ